MSGIAVMLAPSWPNSFGRTVRDESGAVLKRLLFEKAKPQVLGDREFAAVMEDVGKALVYAELDERGNPLSKPSKEEMPAAKKRKK